MSSSGALRKKRGQFLGNLTVHKEIFRWQYELPTTAEEIENIVS